MQVERLPPAQNKRGRMTISVIRSLPWNCPECRRRSIWTLRKVKDPFTNLVGVCDFCGDVLYTSGGDFRIIERSETRYVLESLPDDATLRDEVERIEQNPEWTRTVNQHDAFVIGAKVKDSPQGAGSITSFTERGFPRVNDVAVGWLDLETGETFDPYGVRERHLAERQAQT